MLKAWVFDILLFLFVTTNFGYKDYYCIPFDNFRVYWGRCLGIFGTFFGKLVYHFPRLVDSDFSSPVKTNRKCRPLFGYVTCMCDANTRKGLRELESTYMYMLTTELYKLSNSPKLRIPFVLASSYHMSARAHGFLVSKSYTSI